MKEVEEIVFRASAMGDLMTESRDKKDPLGETCKAKLIEIYIEQCEGRKEDITSKYLEKGLMREEAGIDLYCELKGELHFKNGQRVTDDMLTGHADMLIYQGENVIDIPDIKNSWSRKTYLKQTTKGVTKGNYWQGQTYNHLYNSPKATMVYCLVNTTIELINDEKRKAGRELGIIDIESHPSGLEKCLQIERNMIFDMGLFIKENPFHNLLTYIPDWTYDIPASRRIKEIEIPRNQEDIDRMKSMVPVWRKWIKDNLYPNP